MICLWKRTTKLQSLGSSCKWASNCFAMDSIELSLILDCFGDQITIKSTKTYTIWLETIAKVLNMLIGLKGNNYYSKVFKRVNYKLSNNTFWVVINWQVIQHLKQPHPSQHLQCQHRLSRHSRTSFLESLFHPPLLCHLCLRPPLLILLLHLLFHQLHLLHQRTLSPYLAQSFVPWYCCSGH